MSKQRAASVLFVDDDNELRTLLARAMREAGLEVVEARDGAQAIDRLAERRRFDLVITDLAMPNLNGVELVRYLRDGDFDLEVVAYSSDPGKLREQLPADVRVFDKSATISLVNFARDFTRRRAG